LRFAVAREVKITFAFIPTFSNHVPLLIPRISLFCFL
jgi:hypothetical protein